MLPPPGSHPVYPPRTRVAPHITQSSDVTMPNPPVGLKTQEAPPRALVFAYLSMCAYYYYFFKQWAGDTECIAWFFQVAKLCHGCCINIYVPSIMHTKAHILITLECINAKNILGFPHGDNIHTTQVKRKKSQPETRCVFIRLDVFQCHMTRSQRRKKTWWFFQPLWSK